MEVSSKVYRFHTHVYRGIQFNGVHINSMLLWDIYLKILNNIFNQIEFVGKNENTVINVCNNKLKEYEF
jgi:predicted transcriptional regulator